MSELLNSCTPTPQSPYLSDGVADTTVGHLNLQQRTHCGGDVRHDGRFVGVTWFYFPAHKDQWDVGIVGIPGAV